MDGLTALHDSMVGYTEAVSGELHGCLFAGRWKEADGSGDWPGEFEPERTAKGQR